MNISDIQSYLEKCQKELDEFRRKIQEVNEKASLIIKLWNEFGEDGFKTGFGGVKNSFQSIVDISKSKDYKSLVKKYESGQTFTGRDFEKAKSIKNQYDNAVQEAIAHGIIAVGSFLFGIFMGLIAEKKRDADIKMIESKYRELKDCYLNDMYLIYGTSRRNLENLSGKILPLLLRNPDSSQVKKLIDEVNNQITEYKSVIDESIKMLAYLGVTKEEMYIYEKIEK